MAEERSSIPYADPARQRAVARPYVMSSQRKSFAQSVIALLSAFGWGFLAWVIIYLVLAVIRVTCGTLISFPASVFVVLMFPIAAVAGRSIRRRRATAVLGYLRQAVHLNLPLNRILAAAAEGESRVTARRLTELKLAIDNAVPLADALAVTVPELPERAVELIRFSERVGRLTQTLDQLVREEVRGARTAQGDHALTRWYPAILLLLGSSVIVLFSLFVLPKYQWLFAAFHLPLPPITRWMVGLEGYMWPALILIWVVLLLTCGFQLRTVFRSRAAVRPFRDLVDRILWQVPIVHGLQLDCAMADVCRAVGDALVAGRPMHEAMREAPRLSMNVVVQKRVRQWAEQLDGGQSPEDAARKAHMPAFVSGMLATARSMPAQDEVFEFLHRYYRSRFRLRNALLQGALVPAIVLVMGCFVAMIALAMFLPLIHLVDVLATPGGR